MEAEMAKIEFIKPYPRREDWRVTVNGSSYGSVWRHNKTGEYLVSNVTKRFATPEEAFKAARKQMKQLFQTAA
jgi:hypothetical protein